ncbi:hypothetical protein GCM10009654_61100 [Streptomyces hebeiensis]|uniref:Uncharacterized protein n=1 Tax=Streptomyces hebeiensis TaxID=229486 RepID=A0ABN1V5X3_9ACTN
MLPRPHTTLIANGAGTAGRAGRERASRTVMSRGRDPGVCRCVPGPARPTGEPTGMDLAERRVPPRRSCGPG